MTGNNRHTRLLLTITLWFYLGMASVTTAQRILQCRQFTSDNGLSENVVYSLYQDLDGFLWIGTDYGLNRYDGYTFTHFHKSNTDTTTLSNESILGIQGDSQGHLWIRTYGGLNMLDPHSGLVHRISMPGIGNTYSVQDIRSVGPDSMLVSIGGHGVFFLDCRTRRLHAAHPSGEYLVKEGILALSADKYGFPLREENSTSRVLIINGKSGKIHVQSTNSLFPFALSGHPRFYFQDSQGYHYVIPSAPSVLSVYGVDGERITSSEEISLPTGIPLRTYCAIEIGGEEVWLGTNQGILIFNRQRKSLEYAVLRTPHEESTIPYDIRSLLLDRHGILWMGTYGEGLLAYQTRKSPFKNLSLSEISQNTSRRLITGLEKWSGDTLAIEMAHEQYVLMANGRIHRKVLRSGMTPEILARVTSGIQDDALSPFHHEVLSSFGATNRVIMPQRFLFPDDTTLAHYRHGFVVYTPQMQKRFCDEYIKNAVDDGRFMWLATSTGLVRIEKRTLTDTTFRFDPSNPHALSEDFLYCVYADSAQNLYIGTKGGGLNFFDQTSKKFSSYTTKDGLPDNVIYCIVPDNGGYLWLTTNNGISRFDPYNKTFSNFTRRDGLLNAEFNTRGGLMMPDGTIFLAGTNGLDYFRPEDIEVTRGVPGLWISGWKVNNTDLAVHHAHTLPHHFNHLTFSFTTNDFDRPDLIYFRYRLNAGDSWTRVQGRNIAAYHGLRNGKYRFEVQASYDNLHWSASTDRHFEIRTPWWRSIWFLALCVILIASTAYAVYRYRLEQIQRLSRLRARISRDLHDEVGSSLSSIHVFSSVASRSMHTQPDTATEALAYIHKNARQVMENMNDIIWAINTGEDGSVTFEKKIKNFGYELLSPLGISCSYRIDDIAEQKLRNIEVRKNLLLIAKEAMNNIARYSQATEAGMSLLVIDGILTLRIEDNGRGIDAEIPRSGNGLHNMRSRAHALGGSLDVETPVSGGTLITCRIPTAKIRDRSVKPHL